MPNIAKTEQEYHELAKSKGLEWIGEEKPRQTIFKTLWKCSKGHIRLSSYATIQRAKGCRQCHIESTKKNEKDYKTLADSKSIVWTGKSLPRDTHSYTTWYCPECDYEWKSQYAYISQNIYGCPKCSRKNGPQYQPYTEQHYFDVVKDKPIEWIGKLPSNSKEYTLWRCTECGHEWYTIYNIIQQNRGCPKCAIEKNAEKKRHTIQNYYKLASECNVEFVGPFPPNARTKTLWRCNKCSNEWMTCYGDLKQGYGCPSCVNMVNGKLVSKSQIKLAELVNGELNHRVGNIWIDVALPDRKVAIEYDSWYWHSGRQELDYARAIELINLGWKVLSIKSNTKIPPIDTIDHGIRILSPDTPYHELMMPDWGNGVTWRDVYA